MTVVARTRPEEAVGQSAGGAQKPSLLATMRRFQLAHEAGSEQALRSCLHDEALVETVASGGRVLGPDATAAVLATALRRDPFYVLGDWDIEAVGEEVVLTTVPVRQRSANGGISHWTVYRLSTGRDALIWRQRIFRSRAAALAQLEQHGHGLGL